jgi:hypothetical protein
MYASQNILDMVKASASQRDLDVASLSEAITACLECHAICVMCADACAAEPHATMLARCIRLNGDCADLCEAVARVLGKIGTPHPPTMRTLVEACIETCQACAIECHKHEAEHDHCRICAEACERCAAACQHVLNVLLEGPSA